MAVRSRQPLRPTEAPTVFFGAPFLRGYHRFDTPQWASDWANEFCEWITRRYEFERSTWDTYFPDLDTPEGQLERIADLIAIGADLDLSDPMIKAHHIEWLTEFNPRLDGWRRFQLKNGPQNILKTASFRKS